MSYSTLDDYYRGMKMPSYDGKNIYQQMRSLNAQTTLTAQIHEEHIIREVTRDERTYTEGTSGQKPSSLKQSSLRH